MYLIIKVWCNGALVVDEERPNFNESLDNLHNELRRKYGIWALITMQMLLGEID